MRTTFWLACLAIFAVIADSFFISIRSSDSVLVQVGNIAMIICSICAAVACWRVYFILKSSYRSERKVWFFSAVAFTLFCLGDLYWAFSELVLGLEVPVGSFPDFFWLLAYIFWLISVFILLHSNFISSRMSVYFLIGFAVLCAVVYSVIFFHNFVLYHYSWVDLIQYSYVLFDIILLGAIISFSLPLIDCQMQHHNPLMLTWLLFGGCVVIRVVYDFIFAEMIHSGIYSTGHPIDILYLSSYVVAILAAHSKLKLIGGRK